MENVYLHEAIYRGTEAIEKLGQIKITVCGSGALGSLLSDNLARQGFRQLTAIDHDRIEQHNVGTQLFGQSDVGVKKVDVLKAMLFRSTGIELEVSDRRLDERNVKKLLRSADLVVDTFDNSTSRRIVTDHCLQQRIECLHLGMNADYGEARWNQVYRVPEDVVEGDVCEYPLARNLILLLVAAGCESILRFVLENRRENYSVTLRDLMINIE